MGIKLRTKKRSYILFFTPRNIVFYLLNHRGVFHFKKHMVELHHHVQHTWWRNSVKIKRLSWTTLKQTAHPDPNPLTMRYLSHFYRQYSPLSITQPQKTDFPLSNLTSTHFNSTRVYTVFVLFNITWVSLQCEQDHHKVIFRNSFVILYQKPTQNSNVWVSEIKPQNTHYYLSKNAVTESRPSSLRWLDSVNQAHSFQLLLNSVISQQARKYLFTGPRCWFTMLILKDIHIYLCK